MPGGEWRHIPARDRVYLLGGRDQHIWVLDDDLWQRVFREVSRAYPDVESSHLYIDALCMQMVKDPRQFDVIVTNNMFGDIVTDLGAQLQGGLGMAASGT